jgi:peptide/nickel transport system ATP-binding protein
VLATTCDRVAVMYAGRIIEEAAAHTIFADPRHPYSAALAAAFPRVGDPAARFAPAGLAGDPPDPRRLPTGCTFHPRCPMAIDDCRVVDPPLESVSVGHPVACIRAGDTRVAEPVRRVTP